MNDIIPYDEMGRIDFSELIKLMVKLGFSVTVAIAIIRLGKKGIQEFKKAIE